MSKKVFFFLVLLMSLSLIGIIFIQAYYIKESLNNEKERFKFKVNKVLYNISNTIENNELDNYYYQYNNLKSSGKVDSASVSQLLIYQKNNTTKETLIYKSNVLEENYKLSSSLFEIGLDSIDVKNIIGSSSTEIYSNSDGLLEKDLEQNPISRIIRNGTIDEAQKIEFNKNFKAIQKRTPVHKRVSKKEIKKLLSDKLKKNDVNINFEFAIFNSDVETKVRSEHFKYDKNSIYSVPIFTDENNQSLYRLLVSFPTNKRFIFSSVVGMVLLSVVFTLIILLTYSSALYQLIKQRKISEIKTDFINNMTHEFKTPIATISLALDAIKNPKIINDKEKVVRYLSMIKEENKRMHTQVENVLRISKLEKNELEISKEPLDLHGLVEDAISHVALLIEDKNGYIRTYFNAEKTSILANETHLTNVIVNIFDNAIKYSPRELKIDVYTENIGANVLLKIKDYGSGMSKTAVKRVFEKFYREHTGNIHNVKGHGLGLAYVKRMVEDHRGSVSVESEKDKGSTFTIRLPLIS